jgi:hypothetical protein
VRRGAAAAAVRGMARAVRLAAGEDAEAAGAGHGEAPTGAPPSSAPTAGDFGIEIFNTGEMRCMVRRTPVLAPYIERGAGSSEAAEVSGAIPDAGRLPESDVQGPRRTAITVPRAPKPPGQGTTARLSHCVDPAHEAVEARAGVGRHHALRQAGRPAARRVPILSVYNEAHARGRSLCDLIVIFTGSWHRPSALVGTLPHQRARHGAGG